MCKKSPTNATEGPLLSVRPETEQEETRSWQRRPRGQGPRPLLFHSPHSPSQPLSREGALQPGCVCRAGTTTPAPWLRRAARQHPLRVRSENWRSPRHATAPAVLVVSLPALIAGLFQGVRAHFPHLVREGAHYSLLIRSSVTNLLCTFPASVYR